MVDKTTAADAKAEEAKIKAKAIADAKAEAKEEAAAAAEAAAAKEAEEEIEDEDEEEELAAKNTATVHYKGRTRAYSKEIHGKDYKKLAAQFADKFDGEVK